MKKSIIIALFAFVVGIGGAFAQTSFEKTKKLTDSEVPVAVIKAFQQEHADVKGMWKLYYTEEKVQGKTTFTPTYYSFVGKKDGEKVVFNYAPDGTPTEGKGSGAKK
jgi:hypothetical protein